VIQTLSFFRASGIPPIAWVLGIGVVVVVLVLVGRRVLADL